MDELILTTFDWVPAAARGYVRESVAIRTRDMPECPYWLVSSRRPDELIAALVLVAQP